MDGTFKKTGDISNIAKERKGVNEENRHFGGYFSHLCSRSS